MDIVGLSDRLRFGPGKYGLAAGLITAVGSAGIATSQTYDPELELGEPANGAWVTLEGTSGDLAGFSVAGANDVNGEGIKDLIIGGRLPTQSTSGRAYVVLGTDLGFPAELELRDLLAANGGDGTLGFALNGAAVGDLAGSSVGGAGDVNGDEIDDLIVGAPLADPNDFGSGQAYVVFGSEIGFPAELELGDLLVANGGDGTLGFALNGIAAGDEVGFVVAGAGDLNGDGLADVLVGAHGPAPNGRLSGQAYVVFGSEIGFPAELKLGDLLAANGGDGTLGFALNGVAAGDVAGFSVSGAGDVNGDGIDDLIVGAPSAEPNGLDDEGQAYVVFGSEVGFPAELELGDLLAANGGDGTLGFALNGVAAGDVAGFSVDGAGDVNGDGIDDLIVGAPGCDCDLMFPGQVYVVFGSESGFPAELELGDLLAANGGEGTLGFALNGVAAGDQAGRKVGGAGDINGDTIDDLVVGARAADPNGLFSGQAYVVFGSDRGFPAELELSDLLAANGGDGTLGFALNGAARSDEVGYSVAGTGDVDADGIDDLLVGAPGARGGQASGHAYLVFGMLDLHASLVSLVEEVYASDLSSGFQIALAATLEAAVASLERGQIVSARNELEAFIKQVMAQSGKIIEEPMAQKLIVKAQIIVDALHRT